MSKDSIRPIPQLPEPPNYLLTQELNQIVNDVLKSESKTKSSTPNEDPSAYKPVDHTLYEAALEERRIAEVRSAEIYCKYLELLAYGEKIVRRVRSLERFRLRMRPLYDRAAMGDSLLLDNLNLTRQDLDNARDLINSLNMKNQSLEAAIQNHQEAFLQVSKQTAQAESAMNYANEQFQLLSADYENRGKKILELEKSLMKKEGAILDLTEKLKEMQKKMDKLIDENMLTANQLRQSQIHSSGIETLNEELTNVIPKLQKQIHSLEEKLRIEKESSSQRVSSIQEELQKLHEERQIQHLVAKAKNSSQIHQTDSGSTKTLDVQSTRQWNVFFQRWSGIIDELSSHSAPIRETTETKPTGDFLTSEIGDIELK